MLVECLQRPELRAPVLELIARVQAAHASGEFAMSLADLFATFGLSLSASDQDKLRARGAIQFVRQTESQGEFSNRGEYLELAAEGGLTLVVPPVLAGDYVTTPSSLILKFVEGSALRGCKRVFVLICQDVIKIDIDEHKLYIDLPGERYDLCFVF